MMYLTPERRNLTLDECFFFFFQAEDGIRDYKVTGVQTCALPICQIVWKILLPEALPGIVAGLTISFVSLTGYSAMAGAIGGGGPGGLGIRHRHPRFFARAVLAVVVEWESGV